MGVDNNKQKENSMETHLDINIPEISTVSDCPQYVSCMTEKALRWQLFSNAEFRKRCSRKLGRRVYLLPREVISFIKEQKT